MLILQEIVCQAKTKSLIIVIFKTTIYTLIIQIMLSSWILSSEVWPFPSAILNFSFCIIEFVFKFFVYIFFFLWNHICQLILVIIDFLKELFDILSILERISIIFDCILQMVEAQIIAKSGLGFTLLALVSLTWVFSLMFRAFTSSFLLAMFASLPFGWSVFSSLRWSLFVAMFPLLCWFVLAG